MWQVILTIKKGGGIPQFEPNLWFKGKISNIFRQNVLLRCTVRYIISMRGWIRKFLFLILKKTKLIRNETFSILYNCVTIINNIHDSVEEFLFFPPLNIIPLYYVTKISYSYFLNHSIQQTIQYNWFLCLQILIKIIYVFTTVP
jgi:hypothetical protein